MASAKTTKAKATSAFASIDTLSLDTTSLDSAADGLRKANEEASAAAAAAETEVANLRDLRAAIVNGGSQTAEDLRAAESRVEHAELRKAGADQRLAQLRRHNPVTSLDLITTVHRALDGNVLPGIPLLVGIGSAPAQAPEGVSLPVLVLTQDKGHARAKTEVGVVDPSGGLAGTVHLTYFRDEVIHRPLDVDQVRRALSAAKVWAHSSDYTRSGVDVIAINVTHAVPEVPNLPYPAPPMGEVSHALPRSWMGAIVNAATTSAYDGKPLYGRRHMHPDLNGVYIDPVQTWRPGTSEVVSSEVNDGIRTVVVRSQDHVVIRDFDTLNELMDRIPTFATSVVGNPTHWGKITKATMTCARDPESKGLRARAEFTLASKA